ncbi:hypothetical protein DFQ11_10951 [Winogradskyella epiphytica]|uniref:Uncharacterized protein n=1 Tax=Winogradskyella epiphytica TaxID=262005 RepID=A0A2V4XFU6_9FLAO|nr:hypothetical protein [Winogradskyella epiphytica]PYE79664.1 hypothetical protein DFQ11_10951 [Winogradskyella epiphytica]GGW73505.1 hypothetical protein GCM10008085_27170 [Winogradskyella epiphytica]
MKIGKLSLLIILGIVLFISCSKEEDDLISQNCEANCTEIVGKVMTNNGSTPIPNLKISLVWNHNPNSGPNLIRKKASTKTDDEGNYSLKFYLRDDELDNGFHRLYHDEIENSEFLAPNLNGITALFNLNRDTLLLQNHNVVKKAFVNLTLLNLDDIQGSNKFWTNFEYPSPSGFSQSIDGAIRSWTNDFESNQLLEIAGNQPVVIEIVRKINDITTRENDTIFVDAGTTLNYTVDFNN